MKKEYDSYWKKLDNVGTFYSSLSTRSNPNIYRLSTKTKDKVKKAVLEKALNDTLVSVPSFKVKLKRGLFWYYLEGNNEIPIIKEDQHFPFTTINNLDNNYFLFKVTYYEKRINVDFSHILTDGTGALHFLENLVTNYMKLIHPKTVKKDIIVATELISQNEVSVDSFLKYYKTDEKEMKNKKPRRLESYAIKGDKGSKKNAGVIIGTISTKELKVLSKEKDVTITGYLTALLIYSIYQENYKYANGSKPIAVCIPVNLRNYFVSYSMNNFFSTIMIRVDFTQKDYSFDEILIIVSSEIKHQLSKDILAKKFQSFVKLQHNIISRFVPLVIKDLVLRSIGGITSKRGATAVLSNIGIVNVASEVKEYIDKFDVITYNDNSSPLKVGVCSFEDKLSVCFSSVMNDTSIQKKFFSYLSTAGINVKISASTLELNDRRKK